MAQSVSPTAFGSILYWVCINLKQVEKEMATNPLKSDVSKARQGLEKLLSNEQYLRSTYRNIQKSEYEALVRILQNREIEITDDTLKGTERMLRQFGQANRYPPQIINLAIRAIDKMRGK